MQQSFCFFYYKGNKEIRNFYLESNNQETKTRKRKLGNEN